MCFAESRQYDKILAYTKTVGYTPDYNALLYNIARVDPEQATKFATGLVNDENGPLIEPEKVYLEEDGVCLNDTNTLFHIRSLMCSCHKT